MPFHTVLVAIALGVVTWVTRFIPLTGARRWAAWGCRAAAIASACAALWGPSLSRTQHVPRHVVYLLDGSASIDARQRDWIARRLASLEALRPPSVERAVAVFGRDAEVVVPFGRDRLTDVGAIRRTMESATIDPRQTNLEAGLLAALSVLPPHHRGGVVLLSDGRETAGNVTGLLAYARRLGLEVFPSSVPASGNITTVWDELVIPPVVQRGSPVGLQLVLFNGSDRTTPGQVTVSLAGVAIKRQRVALRPGWQVVNVSVPALRRGTLALDVHLAIPDERLSEHRLAYTEVEGPPQVLLVSERTAALPALANALKRREMEVVVVRPAELPAAAERLLDHDAVLLFNIPKSSLAPEQVEALRAYVEAFGGGLLMVGLGGELAQEIQQTTPLDALLPVTFEPKGLQESKRRVCIILLIDRSASMLGPRIAATKRAAVELIKQLSPEDLVGVLAFDTKPYVIAEVQPASQIGEWVVEKLVTLRSSGGTDIYPALAASLNRLELSGATLKHVILLSDGLTPYHKQAYDALLAAMKLEGITVSTIGIGAAFINTDYLTWLAQSTGGTFYQLRRLDELPTLVARDAQQALGRLPFSEGYFRPLKSPTTEWFAETSDWPPLRGYLTATAKAGARVDLTVKGGEGDDPLLARWSVGRGRAVSFTSDADRVWSPEWIRWAGFDGTWAQIVRWAMRTRLTEELFVWVDEGPGGPTLFIEGELEDPHGAVTAAEGTERLPLALVQTGAWRWSASLAQIPSGWYQLTLESGLPAPPQNVGGAQAGPGAAPTFGKRWVQLGTPPASEEAAGQPPQEPLLRHIARSTAGLYDAPDAAFLPPVTSASTSEPMLGLWLPLVILLVLIDVALRGASML